MLSFTLIINNTKPNFTVQFITSTFGIVIPGMIFFYNYFYKNKNFNAQEKFEKIFDIIKTFTYKKSEDALLLGDGSKDELGLAKEVKLLTEKHVEDLLRGYNLPIDEVPSSVKNAFGQIEKLLLSKAYRKTLEIYLSVEKQ
jgi:hypothetical protein